MGRHGKHRIRNHPTVIKSEISRDFSEQLSITEKIVSPKSKISPSFLEENSCICGMHIEGTVWIGCGKWYHIDCVHLTGLSPDHIKMLTNVCVFVQVSSFMI